MCCPPCWVFLISDKGYIEIYSMITLIVTVKIARFDSIRNSFVFMKVDGHLVLNLEACKNNQMYGIPSV